MTAIQVGQLITDIPGGDVPLGPQERAALAEWCSAWEPVLITGNFNAQVYRGRAIIKGFLLAAGALTVTCTLFDSISNPTQTGLNTPGVPLAAIVEAAIWDGFINSSIKMKNGIWVVNNQPDATGVLFYLPVPTV